METLRNWWAEVYLQLYKRHDKAAWDLCILPHSHFISSAEVSNLSLPQEKLQQENEAIREADREEEMAHTVYLQTWAFMAAMTLRHRPKKSSKKFRQSNYRCCSSELRLVSIDTSVRWKMRLDLNTLCRVGHVSPCWQSCLSKPRAAFRKHEQISHGELQIELSSLKSAQAMH